MKTAEASAFDFESPMIKVSRRNKREPQDIDQNHEGVEFIDANGGGAGSACESPARENPKKDQDPQIG